MSKVECAFCHNQIDSAAKLCVFCGADPQTGHRVDPEPLLKSLFSRKAELPRGEAFLEFVRRRQGIVLTGVVLVVFLLAFGMHRLISNRNDRQVEDVPAIPLTEVADLSNQSVETRERPVPEIPFQFEGNGRAFQTYIVEKGAIAPPQPVPVPATPAANGAPAPTGTPTVTATAGGAPRVPVAGSTPLPGNAGTSPLRSSPPVPQPAAPPR